MTIVSLSTQAGTGDRKNEGDPSKKTAAVQRNILSDKLPSKLLTSIKKEYKSYWITNLYKQDASGKISYHITVENADQIINLSATGSNWSIVRTVSKDLATL